MWERSQDYGATGTEPNLQTCSTGPTNVLPESDPPSKVSTMRERGRWTCRRPDGRVVYWSHEGATYESWPDLAHWIQQVWLEEEDDEDEDEE